METLKIALVDLSRGFGGGQVALANLAHVLSRRNHEVHVILGTENIHSRLSELCTPCSLHKIRGYSNIFEFRDIAQQTKKDILHLDKKHKFDVIDVQGVNGLFIPSQLRGKLIVTLHGNNAQRGLDLLRFTFKTSDMSIAVSHAAKNFLRNVSGHLLFGRFEKKACQNARLVLTLTPTEAYYATKNYSISQEKIRVVPNVIIDLKTNSSHIPHIPQDKQVILSVGALEFIKGTPILAKTMEYVLSTEDVVYVSVGDGPLMGCVKKLQGKFPKRVVILPHLSTSLSSVYASASLLVQASLYESFGLSMAEAMLAGKPVVAFRLASIPDLIADEFTGLLAKPLSSKDLAIKVINLIRDKERACELGFNARKVVNELYNVESVGNRVESVLKEV